MANAKRVLVGGNTGRIYYASAKKDGTISQDRKDITDDCINGVFNNMLLSDSYKQEEAALYTNTLEDGTPIGLCAYNMNKYVILDRTKYTFSLIDDNNSEMTQVEPVEQQKE